MTTFLGIRTGQIFDVLPKRVLWRQNFDVFSRAKSALSTVVEGGRHAKEAIGYRAL